VGGSREGRHDENAFRGLSWLGEAEAMFYDLGAKSLYSRDISRFRWQGTVVLITVCAIHDPILASPRFNEVRRGRCQARKGSRVDATYAWKQPKQDRGGYNRIHEGACYSPMGYQRVAGAPNFLLSSSRMVHGR
jgi:hypothetical protein